MSPNPRGAYLVRLTEGRTPEGRPSWTAEHPDLLGCHVVRGDPIEAVQDLHRVRERWLERAHRRRANIPPPLAHLAYELILLPDHDPADAEAARTALMTASDEVTTIF